jgi:hypothetical protein
LERRWSDLEAAPPTPTPTPGAWHRERRLSDHPFPNEVNVRRCQLWQGRLQAHKAKINARCGMIFSAKAAARQSTFKSKEGGGEKKKKKNTDLQLSLGRGLAEGSQSLASLCRGDRFCKDKRQKGINWHVLVFALSNRSKQFCISSSLAILKACRV